MKTAVEELSPTRVRLSVEVTFEELKPSLDKAYREVSRQVRIPGFRPGKVPPAIIDRRIGRGTVLTEAVNEALPEFYSKAVQEADVFALGQPEVEITQLDDGKDLTFTAEVEVRPKFELPDLAGLSVTVDNAVVTPDDVEEYLTSLRERFASLKTAQRPAENGDFTTIDLSAAVDGKPVEDAQASGLSYQIGSGTMLEGLDEALIGMSGGESATFTSELAGGESAGEQADVTVTVQSVKVKELPELDDGFAQLASEFDTLGELRANTRKQLESALRLRQVGQAQDLAVKELVDSIDIPLPEKFVEHELEHTRNSIDEQLTQARLTMADYLQSRNQTQEEFEAELVEQSQRSVKVAFVLDEVVRREEVPISQAELSYYVADQAHRMGVAPEVYARHLTESGQLGSVAANVLRRKAAELVAERVQVADEAGHSIDIKARMAEFTAQGTAAAQDAESDEAGSDEAGSAEADAETPGEDPTDA